MTPDQPLLDHVVAGTGLSAAEAARVIEEVLAYYRQPLADVVRRRHTQLQTAGVRNAEIFPRLQAELAERVVAAPELSERQLRRLVYG